MEAVGSAFVGLSVYLQLKKATMHEYHLGYLKSYNINIQTHVYTKSTFICVFSTDQLTKKYLTQEVFVFSLSKFFRDLFFWCYCKKNPNYFSTC